jgi:hypothetical protein
MKKLFLFVLILNLLVSCGPGVNPYFGYKPIGYKKKLSKATWRSYNTEQNSGKWIQKDLDWVYIVSFNKSGNIIEASTYETDGNLRSMEKLVYFKDDRVKSSFYDADGELTGEMIFELASDDRYNYKDGDKEDSLSGYVIFSNNYEKESRLIQDYKFVGDRAILVYESLTESKSRYKKYYDEDQKLVYETRNEFLEFNDHGDWIKAIRYDEGEEGSDDHLIIREIEYSD